MQHQNAGANLCSGGDGGAEGTTCMGEQVYVTKEIQAWK